jgi:RNA polymerase sigma factor (TIGR02999 family)
MSTPPSSNPNVSELLIAWSEGDPGALEALTPLVYEELLGIARQIFRRERDDHTLQPTAVVNEAFLKLVAPGGSFRNRAHFFAVASQAMRQILVDHARARNAQKRGGRATHIAVVELAGSGPALVDVIAVDVALTKLASLDRGQASIVELRYFGGLTVEETAEVLEISTPTVKRHWRLARAFLARELQAGAVSAAADNAS